MDLVVSDASNQLADLMLATVAVRVTLPMYSPIHSRGKASMLRGDRLWSYTTCVSLRSNRLNKCLAFPSEASSRSLIPYLSSHGQIRGDRLSHGKRKQRSCHRYTRLSAPAATCPEQATRWNPLTEAPGAPPCR